MLWICNMTEVWWMHFIFNFVLEVYVQLLSPLLEMLNYQFELYQYCINLKKQDIYFQNLFAFAGFSYKMSYFFFLNSQSPSLLHSARITVCGFAFFVTLWVLTFFIDPTSIVYGTSITGRVSPQVEKGWKMGNRTKMYRTITCPSSSLQDRSLKSEWTIQQLIQIFWKNITE